MKFIEENWFKMIVSFAVIIATGSAVYYFVIFLPAQSSFINNLPVGDIDSQKCNELVDAKSAELTASQSRAGADYMNDTTKTYEPAGTELFDLVDSKYLYSHKLCLAEIHTNTYPSSSEVMGDYKIIDLGSGYVFAETIVISSDIAGSNANPKYSYYLNNQEQKNPISISDIWSEIQRAQ